MRALTQYELSEVNGGNIFTTIARWADEVIHAATAVVDSAQIAVNSAIAEGTCGEGNVASVDGDGFTCGTGG